MNIGNLKTRKNSATDAFGLTRFKPDDLVKVFVDVIDAGYVPEALSKHHFVDKAKRQLIGFAPFRCVPDMMADPQVKDVSPPQKVRLVAGRDSDAQAQER